MAPWANAGINKEIPNMKVILKEAMEEDKREQQEREERTRNIVVYRAKDEARENNQQAEHDEKLIKDLLEAIKVDDIQAANITRLGIKKEDTNRPLRFTVRDNEAKSKIMSNLKNLRTASEELKSLVIHHDLTPCQRDAKKQLLEELSKENVQRTACLRGKISSGPSLGPKNCEIQKENTAADSCEVLLGQAASLLPSVTNTRPAPNQNRNNNSNMNSISTPAGFRKKGNIKCFYFNADGLLNKRDELRLLMDLHKPDLVCISEYLPKNFAHPPADSEFSIPGFDCLANHSDPHRGILIYASKHLQATSVSPAVDSSFEEQCWIQTALNSRDKLLVGGIYRSPNSDLTNNASLLCLMTDLGRLTDFSHILVCGDFNLPSINWGDPSVPSTSKKQHIPLLPFPRKHQGLVPVAARRPTYSFPWSTDG
jgi:hypothetical protein